MRIALIATVLEPGKDGVGDYAYSLAVALARHGHETVLLGLRDRFVAKPLEVEVEGVPQLRLPATMGWQEAAPLARRFLDRYKPEWNFLQLSPYAHHEKGLVAGLAAHLKPLVRPGRLAVMLHEIWIGEHVGAPFKEQAIGVIQRLFVRRLVSALAPERLYTSNTTFVTLLGQYGMDAVHLPLFGNIPLVSSRADAWLWPLLGEVGMQLDARTRPHTRLLGLFGLLHPHWQYQPLLDCLNRAVRDHGCRVALVLIGRTGPGIVLWERLASTYSETITFLRVGEQPAMRISELFNSLDAGVAITYGYNLVGKSSAVTAMLEHGLQVIMPNPTSPLRRKQPGATTAEEPQLIRLTPDLSGQIAIGLPRSAPHSRLGQVVERLLADLEPFKRQLPGRAPQAANSEYSLSPNRDKLQDRPHR